MSNTNSSNEANWMAQQLAERAARFQRQHHSNPGHSDNDNHEMDADQDHSNLSDYELAKQLQAKYDAMESAPNQPPSDHADDDDSDIEMLSAPSSNNPNNNSSQAMNGSIDEDHEIALQLQRQFDNEESNVPPPNTNAAQNNPPSNSFEMPSSFTSNSFGVPSFPSNSNFNSNSSSSPNHSHFSMTTTGPDGRVRTFSSSNGQLPPQFASMFGSPSNSNSNPNNGNNQGFNHPFFRNSMPDLFGSSFNEQFNQSQRMSAAQPQAIPMNFNIMMNNHFPSMMVSGAGGNIHDLSGFMQMLQPRPRVADQNVIEQNTATETFAAKKKEKEEKEDDAADPSATCCICLEAFKDGEEVRRLPCLHIFHKSEIDKWLKTGNDKCPICRVPINGQIDQ